MSGRRGLSAHAVVAAATAIVDTHGAEALTLSRVAKELGVKPPSLYNHVASLETLRRDIAMQALRELGSRLGAAAMGRAGRDALHAIAAAFRAYASEHPGLYGLTAQARPEDEEYARASLAAAEPVIAVLRSYDLDEVAAIHATRTLRASLHGFVALENIGGFGLDVDVDDSFTWLVDTLAATLEAAAVGADR